MTTAQTNRITKDTPRHQHLGLLLSDNEMDAVKKGNMVVMESLRNISITGLSGHSCRFESRKPRLVPRALVPQAMDKGCVPVNKEDVKVVEALEAATHTNFSHSLKRALLFRVLDSFAKENNTAKFAASGAPKRDLVNELLGFEVPAKDLSRAWQEYQSIMNGPDPQLPEHPSADAAYKIVNAEDKTELMCIGLELGYEEDKLDGLGGRELRSLLLSRYKE